MDAGLVILDRILVCPENVVRRSKIKLKEIESVRRVQP